MTRIETDGLHSLSIRDLARECGVTPSAPQKHFATKQDLLTALALRGYRELGDLMTGVTLTLPLEKGLIKAATTYVAYVAQHPVLVQLMYGHRSSEQAQMFDEASRQAFSPLDDLLAQARETGEITNNRRHVETFVRVVVRGLGTSISSGAFGPEDEVIVRQVVRTMLEGLRPR
jgi:AcrR family transcriptional regulator